MPRMPVVTPPNLQLRPTRTPLIDVTLQVVTPMFGGGHTTGEVDELHPIRGGSVRGHLRFWWRACNAHRFSSASQLFDAEAAIWGQTAADGRSDAPSAIDVEVEVTSKGTDTPGDYDNLGSTQWMSDGPNHPSYALFPFQRQNASPTSQGRPPLPGRQGVRFTVRLFRASHVPVAREPSLNDAAEAALWAWITFGGVGARTRRGCGALWCANDDQHRLTPPPPAHGQTWPDVAGTWLRDRVARHVTSTPQPNHPTLSLLHGATAILTPEDRPYGQAWKDAVNEMRDFRQQPGFARNPPAAGNNYPGKSRWPEADSIRNITGVSLARHRPPDQTLRYFPRSDLGLPIVFHFKDHGDPPDHTLELKQDGATRMASPFILKPLMISSSRALALVALLDAPRLMDPLPSGGPPSVVLKRGSHVVTTLTNPTDIADGTKAAAVRPLAGETNPRERFLAFVEGRWHTGRFPL